VLQGGRPFLIVPGALTIITYKNSLTHAYCRILTYDPSTALVLLSSSSHGLLVDASLVVDPDAVLSPVKWGGTLDPNVDFNWMRELKAWAWVIGWLEKAEVCSIFSVRLSDCFS
jgi:hypothetical protein